MVNEIIIFNKFTSLFIIGKSAVHRQLSVLRLFSYPNQLGILKDISSKCYRCCGQPAKNEKNYITYFEGDEYN